MASVIATGICCLVAGKFCRRERERIALSARLENLELTGCRRDFCIAFTGVAALTSSAELSRIVCSAKKRLITICR
jgi:hypothetical protein